LSLFSVSNLFHKKIREQEFEIAPFSFGDETYKLVTIREGLFLTPWLFQGIKPTGT
jgi:hypothetical protein